MESRYCCCRDLVPFAVMVTMECMNVGLNTLFKAATSHGMSQIIFIVYAYGLAALVLIPATFVSNRSRPLPPPSRSVICKIGLLGMIGASSQMIGFTGIKYSSPSLASAISNLTPAFTFILALLFRMEQVTLRKTSSQAKIIGTIVSISGAFVVTLYRGPPIIITPSPTLSWNHFLTSSHSGWVLGGLCFMIEYTLVPLWYIVQTQIMKEYPNEPFVILFYDLCVSMIAAVVGLLTEGTSSAWRIGPNVALASVLCSGLLGSCLNNTVHAWALRVKGPVFVAMFKPLSIAIAVAMGVAFLGDTLYLGSLVGAMIIAIGFYTVIWGKSKEEMGESLTLSAVESSSTQKVPLLQNYKNEV